MSDDEQSRVSNDSDTVDEENEVNYPIIAQALGEIYEEGMTVKEMRHALAERIIYYDNIANLMVDDDLITCMLDNATELEDKHPKEERITLLRLAIDGRKAIINKEIDNWLSSNVEDADSEDADSEEDDVSNFKTLYKP